MKNLKLNRGQKPFDYPIVEFFVFINHFSKYLLSNKSTTEKLLSVMRETES